MNFKKKVFFVTVFTLATLAWATAQQPNTPAESSSGQATSPSPSSQAPNPTQSPSTMPDSTTPGTSAMNTAPVTEGCLGGSNPNYTITDKAGTTYRLNIPPSADASSLAQHVGESVQVSGTLNSASKAINVQGIGRGTGSCTGSKGAKTPPQP